MNTHTLFSDKSEIYAKARPRYPKQLFEWLAEVCQSTEKVWDAACGNGQAAADLQHYFHIVEASDISPEQIANAPEYDRVNFSVQASESTHFDDNSFDAVCVAQSLHWFHYNTFWPEVKRVLKPGCVFAAWGYTWPRLETPLDGILNETFLKIIKPYWAPQNRLLWDGYTDVHFPFTPLHPPTFHMCVDWDVNDFFTYLHSWSATRRCMDDVGKDFFHESYEQIKSRWGDEERRKVSMEFFFIAGRNET
ncbi:MAG: class I SAM-dependent methyltransferase [Candidatus Marinimicrobia bacterium]|nr:class I SAM-dependent methyltransferase [Candidatus Neomarinimicrobiota bacterium]